MKSDEYLRLQQGAALILGADLLNQADRTLLFGFTQDHETHHVYLQDGVIHTVRYLLDGAVREYPIFDNENYKPDKRVYPTRSDFEFCLKLQQSNVHLTYTTYDERELTKKMHGVYFGRILCCVSTSH